MKHGIQLCFGGHSIAYGYGTGSGIAGRVTQPYPSQVLGLLGSYYRRSHFSQDEVVLGPPNVAVDGRHISDISAAEYEVFRPNIACLDIGTNDVIAGGNGMSNGTADALAASMLSAVAAKVASLLALSPKIIVLVSTILSGGVNFDAGMQRCVSTYNSLLTAGGDPLSGGGRALIVDPTVDAFIQDATNATYRQADQLHYTNVGYGRIAVIWALKIIQARGLLLS